MSFSPALPVLNSPPTLPSSALACPDRVLVNNAAVSPVLRCSISPKPLLTSMCSGLAGSSFLIILAYKPLRSSSADNTFSCNLAMACGAMPSAIKIVLARPLLINPEMLKRGATSLIFGSSASNCVMRATSAPDSI